MKVKKNDGRSQIIPVKRKIKQHAKARVTKNISEQVEGGEELQQSVMLAGEILRPVTNVSEKGAALFKESVLEKKREKYKISTPGEKKDTDAVTAKASRENRAKEKNKMVSREKQIPEKI